METKERGGDRRIKLIARGLLIGMIVAVFAVSMASVNATDFSGYVQAVDGVHWMWGPLGAYNRRPIAGGEAWMDMFHWYIQNVGGVPLTEAILRIIPAQLEYYDESGTLITVTDPVELVQLFRIENSDEMWQDGYVIWLGTIKPGHSKRAVVQFRLGVSNWKTYSYYVSVWYLP